MEIMEERQVELWNDLGNMEENGVLGCIFCWSTDRILHMSSCRCGPLHASFCGLVDWTPCRIPHRNMSEESTWVFICRNMLLFSVNVNMSWSVKNTECQWRFCHCIYCSDADVKEVTHLLIGSIFTIWLANRPEIATSDWFNFQWYDWLVL